MRGSPEVALATQLPGCHNTVIEKGDFRLELDIKTAYVGGKQLHLSVAEFDLLEFLITHQKKLITPPAPVDCNHEPNCLQAAISLRKKLETASPSSHYLRTEPWILCSFNPIG